MSNAIVYNNVFAILQSNSHVILQIKAQIQGRRSMYLNCRLIEFSYELTAVTRMLFVCSVLCAYVNWNAINSMRTAGLHLSQRMHSSQPKIRYAKWWVFGAKYFFYSNFVVEIKVILEKIRNDFSKWTSIHGYGKYTLQIATRWTMRWNIGIWSSCLHRYMYVISKMKLA